MAASKELHTLAQVSSEIDDSEIKITYANQCLKAQQTLINKLKEEIQRKKDLCNSKKGGNLKLEAEIKNAELEIENLRITHISVKRTNTDMKKNLLLAKERKFQISEHIKRGEQKYEELWIQSKKRYESIPLVQTLMEAKKLVENRKNDIDILESEAQSLQKAIKVKKEVLIEKDKKMVIQLSNFLVSEKPVALKTVQEKNTLIDKLTKEIESFEKKQEDNMARSGVVDKKFQNTDEQATETQKDKWCFDDALMIPKLHLPSADLDINFRLDINKITLHTTPNKRPVPVVELVKNVVKRTKADEQMKNNYISCYFNKIAEEDKQEEAVNFSKKKLINIIEDIKIDDGEAYQIVARANIDKFQDVNVITAPKIVKETVKSKGTPIVSQEIEEIDMTSNNPQHVLIPPTQFLDLTQANAEGTQEVEATVHVDAGIEMKTSQESKKKVSFDLPVETQDIQEDLPTVDLDKSDGNPNENVTSELEMSAASEDNYMAIKDFILKKHNLDLSPQFIYAKNNILQKKNDNVIVKSKFFGAAPNKMLEEDIITTQEENNNAKTLETEQTDQQVDQGVAENPAEYNIVSMDVDNNAMTGSEPMDKPVAGLLFTHGPQGQTDLDISMSTTGYEEGDPEFPNCLDSSLLHSPKADLPMPMSGNEFEVTSQDVPNFLSGFRKTGLSFFQQSAVDTNPDSSKQNNFNFNFGGNGDEKKGRGSLFSFFH